MGIFSTEKKIRKDKMFVLSRQSLLSVMHIAEKNCTAQFASLIFPIGLFLIVQYWRKSHVFFQFLKLLISEKIKMK